MSCTKNVQKMNSDEIVQCIWAQVRVTVTGRLNTESLNK